MKFSTMGHYGLRSLIDVAMHESLGPVTLNDISQRQSISVKYLWQVIAPLKTAGFLSVTRGAKGGYMLARPPREINMLDVLTTLEGPISVLQCMEDDPACHRVKTCAAHTLWTEVNQAIEKTLSATTLDTLVRKQTQAAAEQNAVG